MSMYMVLPAEGPASPDAWKRAVARRAPDNFRIRLLPPEKQGSSYSYGFRVSPIRDDDTASTTRTSSCSGSIALRDEYVIWRRWEDCLWFQENLETTYSLAAREKRSRLAAGKGVKKNGVYIHSDQAASWESLPFGPDPSDVARDIYHYIPKLSKKGTLFRASQETVSHRSQELKMMLHALFQDDLPTLIKEIKATRTFTDFFSLWGRDVDLAQKAQRKSEADRPRMSLSNNIRSAFPVSPGSLSAKSSSQIKGKARTHIHIHPSGSACSDSSSEERPSRLMDRGQGTHSMRSRASSSASRSSSSTPSTPVTMPRQLPATSQQPVIVSPEMPIKFGHSPHALSGERNSFALESLPEDRELSSPKSDLNDVWPRRRTESAGNLNRNARVYVPSESGLLESSEPSSRSLSRHSRATLQSTHSSATLRAAAYLDELGVDYCLPSPTPEPRRFPRASVSSMASLVTNSSVDAVIPRCERPSRLLVNNVRRPREYELCSDDDSTSESQGDILDDYFQDMIAPFVQTPTGYPETPTVDDTMYHFSREQSTTTVSSYFSCSDRRSSWTTSISSGSTSSSGNLTTLSIKAMHEDNIVMLRLPRCITYDELRQRIYDKFVHIANSTICGTFAIALIEQVPTEKVGPGRPRAGSMSSLGSGPFKGATLHFISSQDEWDDVAATHCGKLVLRIIGSRE